MNLGLWKESKRERERELESAREREREKEREGERKRGRGWKEPSGEVKPAHFDCTEASDELSFAVLH